MGAKETVACGDRRTYGIWSFSFQCESDNKAQQRVFPSLILNPFLSKSPLVMVFVTTTGEPARNKDKALPDGNLSNAHIS